jgi:hypothetical protein
MEKLRASGLGNADMGDQNLTAQLPMSGVQEQVTHDARKASTGPWIYK